MQIDKNDPRLTAYALGELPEDEVEQISKLIEGDDELQKEVEEIRAFAGALRESLAQEPVGVKDAELKKVVAPAKKRSRVGRIIMYTSAIAAVFVFAVGIIHFGEQSCPTFEVRDVVPKAEEKPASSAAKDMSEDFWAQFRSEFGVTSQSPKKDVSQVLHENQTKNLEEIRSRSSTEVQPNNPIRYPKDWSKLVKKRNISSQSEVKKAEDNSNKESGRRRYNVRSLQKTRKPEVMVYDIRDIAFAVPTAKQMPNGDDDDDDDDDQRFNTETYDQIVENGFKRVSEHPLSTFSIDVDTASYSNVRRMLKNGKLPPAGAVRIEEMVNYFDYDYRTPNDDKPFATHMQAVKCPWNEKHNLLRVGLKGKMVAADERPQGNFVFLLDVSGSMSQPNKLPLVVEGMKLLVNQLNEKDRVAIVVYAGASGLVLPSTSCADKHKIIEALDRLNAGGSTNGGQGITLAYATAAANFVKGGINRVILCTDGDFNIGMTNQSDLVRLIEKKAKENVFLTVLGFGMGNYKDSNLEKLADKGNGNYGYIDTLSEAKKMLVEQLSGTLLTIAKDVKIQIEFNPAAVKAYRLIGYENRKLNKEDFNDDKKDAGEIGAGHTVTALYELIPAGTEETLDKPKVDTLKYQKTAPVADETAEMLTLKLRYKEPDEDTSKLIFFPLKNSVVNWSEADMNTRFASSVAAFGMLLRKSKYSGNADYVKVIDWAGSAKGKDHFGYRQEFIGLVRAARSLSNR